MKLDREKLLELPVDSYPPGFQAAKDEWDEFELKCRQPRPYTLALWNQLTLGEQAGYGRRECKTKGAVYKTRVTPSALHLTIELPESLIGSGFSEEEAKQLENAAHRKMEDTIHWILVRRALAGETE